MVSIITVVKNSEQTIENAILSVNSQRYPNIEHIVIDGASTDNTFNIVLKYKNYLSTFISEKDSGIYDAMNKGIARAKGSIIGFLNADDVYSDNNVISDVVTLMEENGSDAVFGDLIYVKPQKPHKIVRYYDSSSFNKRSLAIGTMPAHPTIFLKKKIYEKFGSFKTNYRIAADFEFVARVFSHASLSYSYLPRVMVKMNTGGVSTKSLRSNLILNREILLACRQNGIKTNLLKILLKYPAKIKGLIDHKFK